MYIPEQVRKQGDSTGKREKKKGVCTGHTQVYFWALFQTEAYLEEYVKLGGE